MPRLTFAGGRNTVNPYPRYISRGTLESTFELDSTEPVVEFEWGFAVKSDVFAGRFYTVRMVGNQLCGSCRDERIRPRHIQAVLDFIAAQESAA